MLVQGATIIAEAPNFMRHAIQIRHFTRTGRVIQPNLDSYSCKVFDLPLDVNLKAIEFLLVHSMPVFVNELFMEAAIELGDCVYTEGNSFLSPVREEVFKLDCHQNSEQIEMLKSAYKAFVRGTK